MKTYRIHGKPPYRVVLLHGGPGAWGEMAPLGQILQTKVGCLELFQTAPTLQGQLDEITDHITKYAQTPIILIGFSWGAWLAYLWAASKEGQQLVSRVILIGSGPYQQPYFDQLQATRLSRMSSPQQEFYQHAFEKIQGLSMREKDQLIQKLGTLCEGIDHVDPLSEKEQIAEFGAFSTVDFDIDRISFFQQALQEVMEYRKTGKLTRFASQISCPVYVIHGDFDPHPFQGVIDPLKTEISEFHYKILSNCGHKPWIEREVIPTFKKVLLEFVEMESTKKNENKKNDSFS